MKYVFIGLHALLGALFLKTGIEPYWQGIGGWDAGALHLFIAFWFFFAGIGFYRHNIWLVSMSSLALGGLLGLMLFLDLLEFFQTASNTSIFAQPYLASLAVIGFLIIGEIYAIWRFRRPANGPRQTGPGTPA